MKLLDVKIRETFSGESVYKAPERYGVFSGKNLPSFIKDWLINKFTDNDGNLNKEELLYFLDEHIPHQNSPLKGNLVNDSQSVVLLCRIIIEPDVKTGILRFSIPDFGIKMNEGKVHPFVARKYPELKGGEVWGVVTLDYTPPEGKEKGVIEITNYKPFKPYDVDLGYYRSLRTEYSLEEWVDLLIRSMEYNPEGFESLTQKMLFASRLLVFVEPRLNLIELAPKGTGKSYIFGNLSKYGWIISGGIVTRAKLFYDIGRNAIGLVPRYDYVAVDEIETIKFSDEMELLGALKTYLEAGYFTVGNVRQTSNASFILLGNIPLSSELKPLSTQYFKELPKVIQNSALLDRFHGFIEGWKLPRINESLKIRGYALNVEYFSEILHSLRGIGDFASTVDELLEIPKKADTRDVTALKRLCSGYMKLLFPNVHSASDIDKKEFEDFCLNPAMEKRGLIRKQIHLLDYEFKDNLPLIKVK